MPLTLAQVASSFVAPALALGGVLAVSIPIVIHLLSRFRRKPMVWGAMRFVYEAIQRRQRRLQMEQWVLLAVRCLLVLVLGLALAGPILTGCSEQWRQAGFMGAQTRTVHLVVDDALSSRAVDPTTGAARFEALRDTAVRTVDALGPGETVRVWRASAPVEEITARATDSAANRDEARAALQRLEPRHSRPALGEALRRVNEALVAESTPNRRDAVVVLSDWSAATVREAGDAVELPAHVALLATPPAAEAANVQVAAAAPWRRVAVAGAHGRLAVPIEVTLRRFGDAAEEDTLAVALFDDNGRAVGEATRPIAWQPAQTTQTVTLDAPVDAGLVQPLDRGDRLVLAVRASLGGGGGALREDDARYAVIDVRRQLAVGLVHEPGVSRGDAGFEPSEWIRLALSPNADGPVDAAPLAPSALNSADDAALAAVDALVVLRPELLNDGGWSRLARYVERGGVAWVVPTASTNPSMWPRSMRGAFGLDWRLAIEPEALGDAERGVGLALDARPPAALSLLAADWEALLRPIRVYRWLPAFVPPGDAWLRLSLPGAGAADDETPALLARYEHGRGVLYFGSVAMTTEWTNLPTKPLFVPLAHEAIRSGVGNAAGEARFVAGQTPALDARWPETVSALQALPIGTNEAPPRLRFAGDDRGSPTAADEPGVYADPSRATPMKLAVNVDADAGDTTPAPEEARRAWLDAWGAWRPLDPTNPIAALRAGEAAGPNLAWPLLWVLLGLVLLETCLARAFSHAKSLQHRGLTTVFLERVRRFHRVHHDSPRGSATETRGRAA